MKIQLNLEKEHVYLLSLVLLISASIFVLAAPLGTTPNPGHSGGEFRDGSIMGMKLADNLNVTGNVTISDKLDVDGNITVGSTDDVCIQGGNCLSDAAGGGSSNVSFIFNADNYQYYGNYQQNGAGTNNQNLVNASTNVCFLAYVSVNHPGTPSSGYCFLRIVSDFWRLTTVSNAAGRNQACGAYCFNLTKV